MPSDASASAVPGPTAAIFAAANARASRPAARKRAANARTPLALVKTTHA